MYNKIDSLMQKYFDEAEKSVTNTAPSSLRRGEGTLCDYYILKIDLCGSTAFLRLKQHTTYLKLAHVFLSSIDHITQHYGAESSQNEYAGDSVIAYFRCDAVDAFNVLLAAYYCRHAAAQMKDAYPAFKGYEFKTKVMLHKAKLIIAKIGPWGAHRVTAIGYGLHHVCKMEQKVKENQGRATTQFVDALGKTRSRFVNGNFIEEAIPVAPILATAPIRNLSDFAQTLYSTPPPSEHGLLSRALAQPADMSRPLSGFAVSNPESRPSLGLLSGALQQPTRSLSDRLYDASPTVAKPPVVNIKRTLVDYTICWGTLRMYTEGRLKL